MYNIIIKFRESTKKSNMLVLYMHPHTNVMNLNLSSTVWRLRRGPGAATAEWWTWPSTAQTPDPSVELDGHRRAVELSLHAPRVQWEVGIRDGMPRMWSAVKVQRQDRPEHVFWECRIWSCGQEGNHQKSIIFKACGAVSYTYLLKTHRQRERYIYIYTYMCIYIMYTYTCILSYWIL